MVPATRLPGYPDGLIGEQVSLEARAVAAADVFDALISSRSDKTT
ncbi:MAG: HD domain-containing phosphohydrolase [Lysobacter sp.]